MVGIAVAMGILALVGLGGILWWIKRRRCNGSRPPVDISNVCFEKPELDRLDISQRVSHAGPLNVELEDTSRLKTDRYYDHTGIKWAGFPRPYSNK